MLALLEGLIRNVKHWVVTNEPLRSNASAGDTTLHIRSTKRLRPGDQFLIRNNITGSLEDADTENFLYVDQVIDDEHITITDPLTLSWSVAENSSIVRTFGPEGQFVKAVHLGEPDTILENELPCVTVWGTAKQSEPLALRTTKERYNIEIAVFVADGTLEDGVRTLLETTKLIERGLKKNLYPLVEDYDTTSLTEDAITGDCFIKVPDSTVFQNRHVVILEGEQNVQEFMILSIPDSATVRLQNGVYWDFPTDETTVILPNRFIYNAWPADIKFDKIFKGTLLKAAVINYFAEEAEDQFVSSWYDTQLK